jgi:hypothetical protein
LEARGFPTTEISAAICWVAALEYIIAAVIRSVATRITPRRARPAILGPFSPETITLKIDLVFILFSFDRLSFAPECAGLLPAYLCAGFS